MIANYRSTDIKPGSMVQPLPGIEDAVVFRYEDRGLERVEEPNQEGELALRPGWPSKFRGIWASRSAIRASAGAPWR